MKTRLVHPLATGLLLVLASQGAWAQQSVRDLPHTLIESQRTYVEVGEEEGEEKGALPAETLPPTMVGLEAYREVMQSGRYLVGPGDEFLVHATNMEEPAAVQVLAEGGLHIPGIGRIEVGGLSLAAAREKVNEAFARFMQVGEVQLELSKPRKFPVPVVGRVEGPGIVIASGVERVSEVIRKAQGLSENASTRNIRLVRISELPAEVASGLAARLAAAAAAVPADVPSHRVDLELYYVTGDSRYNPFVVDGDIVVVPPRHSMIRGLEAVQRSAVFEHVEGDRISDLLTLCMGFAAHYDRDNVVLFRYDESGVRQKSIRVDVDGVAAGDPQADLLLQSGDWLVARPLADYQQAKTVRVIGEVHHPGFYVLDEGGGTVSSVIARAGGFTERAALPKARLVRPVTAEEARDPELDRILSIPTSDRSEDEQQYFNMKSRERRGQMVVDFVALFEAADRSQDIGLMPGDVIQVPSRLNMVYVSGQAAFPGAVPYEPGYSVWDYIERAGGFGWRASRDVRVVEARTGAIIEADEVNHIDPGDRIWIKEKPERDYWSIFTQTMNVVGQVSTIVLLYVTIVK